MDVTEAASEALPEQPEQPSSSDHSPLNGAPPRSPNVEAPRCNNPPRPSQSPPGSHYPSKRSKKVPTKDSLIESFYFNLINVPLQVRHTRLSFAMSAYKKAEKNGVGGGTSNLDNKSRKRNARLNPREQYHCELCQDSDLYRAPNNTQIRFDVYSRLTQKDMECALFQRPSPTYSTVEELMKVVKQEQSDFIFFLKSLQPKFDAGKRNLPHGFREAAVQYHKELSEFYYATPGNFRIATTHELSEVSGASANPNIERYGVILSYGTPRKLRKIKLGFPVSLDVRYLVRDELDCHLLAMKPVVKSHRKRKSHGHVIKESREVSPVRKEVTYSAGQSHDVAESRVTSVDEEREKYPPDVTPQLSKTDSMNPESDVSMNNSESVLPKNAAQETSNSILKGTSPSDPFEDPGLSRESLRDIDHHEESLKETSSSKEAIKGTSSSEETIKETSSSVEALKETVSSEKALKDISSSEETIKETVSSEEALKDISSSVETSTATPSPDDNGKRGDLSRKSVLSNDTSRVNGSQKPPPKPITSSVSSAIKHVHVPVSADIDLFITDIPINQLDASSHTPSSSMNHPRLINFLSSLKIAEVVTDLESLLCVLTTSYPTFFRSFQFYVDVEIQEDRSKYFKISCPLPQTELHPESIKAHLVEACFRAAASKEQVQEGDSVNIQFMEYLTIAGATFYDKAEGVSAQEQLKDFNDAMKTVSFIPWESLNTDHVTNTCFSLYGYGGTNFIVGSPLPYYARFRGSMENVIVYVKVQHFCEFGFESLERAELTYIYFKVLLSDCVGVIIVYYDITQNRIVHIDEKDISDFTATSFTGAFHRLSTFFDTLQSLEPGRHVYRHTSRQTKSFTYQQLSPSSSLLPDLTLKPFTSPTISTATSPTEFDRSLLTPWQRHAIRLPLCYFPRRAGTYICHEFLAMGQCSKVQTCAFAHVTDTQLKAELGPEEYLKFSEKFKRPREERKSGRGSKRSNFGVIRGKSKRGRKK